jgi:cytochrome P450
VVCSDVFRQYPNVPYTIKATEGPQVIIPARFLAELRGLPESTLSSVEAIAEALQSRYTGFSAGDHGHLLTAYVGGQLSQNLARLAPRLRGELEHITETEFPACDDWTPVRFQPFALRAVARISGRAFVGAGLNRTEAWMDTSINYAVHVYIAVVKLQLFPECMRPAGQYLVSELGKIRRDVATARLLLEPIVAARLRGRGSGGSSQSSFSSASSEPCSADHDDMIQWLVDATPEGQEPDIEAITKLQLIIAAASIHTTNNLLTECMYDLAAHPEVQEILREEARLVLGRENGWLKRDAMTRLEKMDSFIKETQRVSGNISESAAIRDSKSALLTREASFIRTAVKPITLSDGTHLPAGTKLLAPMAGFSRDERFFADPDQFDALRFYNLRREREAAGDEQAAKKWQFTSVAGETNLHFGAGRHACPGRFFAATVIKMALAFFLQGYEVRLKEGDGRPPATGMVMSKAANSSAELLFRRRSVGDDGW